MDKQARVRSWGLGNMLGLLEAEAPGNEAVTNDRQHECQGLVNAFLFLNRLTAGSRAFCNFFGSQSQVAPGAAGCVSSAEQGQSTAGSGEILLLLPEKSLSRD